MRAIVEEQIEAEWRGAERKEKREEELSGRRRKSSRVEIVCNQMPQ